VLPATAKQNLRAIAALLSAATTWGLLWYPYRLLAERGVSGELSTLLTYSLALALGLAALRTRVTRMRRAPMVLLWIGLSAGWTNLAYVLATIQGEVMRVLLLFYLAPFWTVWLSRLLLDEKLRWQGSAVLLLAFSGALVMLWQPQGAPPIPQNAAEWLGLSSGVTFALANVLTRKAQAHDVPSKALTSLAGVVFLAFVLLLVQGELPPALASVSAPAMGWLVFVGVVILGVNVAVQFGLTHTPANQAVVILLFELVVAAIGAYWLAGETMELKEWIGGAMIVASSLFSGKLGEKRSLAGHADT
jgi:drug/metabolite transporter (DMT)-like permease